MRSAFRPFILLKADGIPFFTLLSILHSALVVTIPFLTGRFIDALTGRGRPLPVFCSMAAASGLSLFLDILSKDRIQAIARREEEALQQRLLAAFRKMAPLAAGRYPNGEIGMKFFRDSSAAGQFLSGVYPVFLGASCSILFALALALYKNAGIALVYLLFLFLMGISLSPYGRTFHRINHALRKIYDSSMNRIFEFMHVYPFLKSMAADEPYARIQEARFRRFRKMNRKNERSVLWFETVNRTFLFLGESAVLAAAGFLAWRKEIPVGDVVMFQMLFLSVLNAFSGIFQLLPSLERTAESMRSVNELMDAHGFEDTMAGKPIPSAAGNIIVRNISFSYPDSGKKIFDHFSCRVKGRGIVALTGRNGMGKTTLLRLLTGYAEPQSGMIEIEGAGLSSWQRDSLRRKTAAVFQDSLLITGTIRENITLKEPAYSPEDIETALRLSGADSIVRRMPEGLDHFIGFEGGGLSGGERQKIAIARALIRKPELLIFDEVTNHLDYESRIRMRDLISQMRGKTTILLVSHDPELIQLCDQVIDLDKQEAR